MRPSRAARVTLVDELTRPIVVKVPERQMGQEWSKIRHWRALSKRSLLAKVSRRDLSTSSLISFCGVTLVFLFVPRPSFPLTIPVQFFFFTTEFCHWNVKYFLRTSEDFFFPSLALLSLVTHCFTFWFHRHLHAASAIITCLRGVSGPQHHHHPPRPLSLLRLTLFTEPFTQMTAMSLTETRKPISVFCRAVRNHQISCVLGGLVRRGVASRHHVHTLCESRVHTNTHAMRPCPSCLCLGWEANEKVAPCSCSVKQLPEVY